MYRMIFQITSILMNIGKICMWRGHMAWCTWIKVPNRGCGMIFTSETKKKKVNGIICWTILGVKRWSSSRWLGRCGSSSKLGCNRCRSWTIPMICMIVAILRLLPAFCSKMCCPFAINTRFLITPLRYVTIFFFFFSLE